MNHFQDSLPGYGIATIMFKTVEVRAVNMRTTLIDAYTKDMYIDKIEGAYKVWRDQIDKMLFDTDKYATKPVDCLRFV